MPQQGSRAVPRRLRVIVRAHYWVTLSLACAVWTFAVVQFVELSILGQSGGEPLARIGLTAFAVIVQFLFTAFLVALWKLRRVRGPVAAWHLATMPKPRDPAEASAWWWTGAFLSAFVCFIVLFAVGLVIRHVGHPVRTVSRCRGWERRCLGEATLLPRCGDDLSERIDKRSACPAGDHASVRNRGRRAMSLNLRQLAPARRTAVAGWRAAAA